MKKFVLIAIGLFGTCCGVHAERKPWPRRPGVVLYQMKSGSAARSHAVMAQAQAPAGRDEEDLAADLMKTGTVAYAEPDYLMPVAALPNDPGFPSQWYHQTIHSQAAWDLTTGNPSVRVAVCDTGVDASHPDLAASVSLPGFNSADGTDNTAPVISHGTGVAGIIGAAGNNGVGGAGVAWNIKILPVRVTNHADGSAWCSDMAGGIEWAADHGARVINLSYDITGCPNTIDSAARYAQGKGAVTFVAAGNSGINLSGSSFPPTHAFILVGATDENGQRASFSNYGQPIDLTAPGVSIYMPSPGGAYAYASGTSFSAPISAGVAALIFSLNSAWTPDQIRLFMLATAVPSGAMNGYGRVDAFSSLSAAKTVLAGGPFPVLPGSPGAGAAAVLSNLDSILAYPNPWRADRHGAAVPLVIGNVTADSTVKIFTLSGFLVKSLTPSQNKASWDLKNDSGDPVASGIYFYSVKDSLGNQAQGKLAVIR